MYLAISDAVQTNHTRFRRLKNPLMVRSLGIRIAQSSLHRSESYAPVDRAWK
jgi:hypothetical protein